MSLAEESILKILNKIHKELVRMNDLQTAMAADSLREQENYVNGVALPTALRVTNERATAVAKAVEWHGARREVQKIERKSRAEALRAEANAARIVAAAVARAAHEATLTPLDKVDLSSNPVGSEPVGMRTASILSRGEPAPADTAISGSVGTILPHVAPPGDDEPAYFDVSGPGPHMQGVRTVLVTSDNIKLAHGTAEKWARSTDADGMMLMLISTKESRDAWTKKIRTDPQAFESERGNHKTLFVVSDTAMQPHSWRPAFDVIAIVIAAQNGPVYTLLKGRRGRE